MKTMKKNQESAIARWLKQDRFPIAFKTCHCHNEGCPEGAWPDGTPRLLPEDHFDSEGICKHRKNP